MAASNRSPTTTPGGKDQVLPSKLAVPNQFKRNLHPPSRFLAGSKEGIVKSVSIKSSRAESSSNSGTKARPTSVQQEVRQPSTTVNESSVTIDNCGTKEKYCETVKNSYPSKLLFKEFEHALKLQSDMHAQLERQSDAMRTQSMKASLEQEQIAVENKSLKDEINSLRKELNSLDEESRKEKDTLEHLCAKYLSQIDSLKQNCILADQAMKDGELLARTDKLKLENILADKQKQITALERELESLNLDNSRSLKQLSKNHNEEIALLRSKFKSDLQEVQHSTNLLKEQLSDKATAYVLLKEQYEALLAEKNSMSKQIGTLNENMKVLVNKKQEEYAQYQKHENDFHKTFSEVKKQTQEQIFIMKEDYARQLATKDYEVKALSEKLSKTEESLVVAQNSITQLQTYIANEVVSKDSEQMNKKIAAGQERIKELEELTSSQGTSINLLNVRLQALNNILEMQDMEMKKSHVILDADRAANLLEKWRTKVYSLLVQLKSKEITDQDEKQTLVCQLKQNKKYQDELQIKSKITESELSDKKAELSMRKHEITEAKKNLERMGHDNNSLKSSVEQYNQAYQVIKDVLVQWSSMHNSCLRDVEKAVGVQLVHERRLQFAAKRLQMIKGLLHGEKFSDDSGQEITDDSKDQVDLESCLNLQLQHEVETVTSERDVLLSKMETFGRLAEEKLSAVKTEYEEKLAGQLLTISELRQRSRDMESNRMNLLNEVQESKRKVTELEEENELLRQNVRHETMVITQELKEKFEREREELVTKISNLEGIVDASQREHAKTTVAFRQQQRQSEWEQKTLQEQMDQQRLEYDEEISRLKLEIKRLEKDRNIFLSTIKQEGIKTRGAKTQQMTPDEEECEESEEESVSRNSAKGKPKKRKGDVLLSRSNLRTKKSPSEDPLPLTSSDLNNVLSELHLLSTTLLQETDDVEDQRS